VYLDKYKNIKLGDAGMGRKNKNARLTKPIKEIKESKVVVIDVNTLKRFEKMSPGELVAVAEWRGNQYA
jgi:hypothetical protein